MKSNIDLGYLTEQLHELFATVDAIIAHYAIQPEVTRRRGHSGPSGGIDIDIRERLAFALGVDAVASIQPHLDVDRTLTWVAAVEINWGSTGSRVPGSAVAAATQHLRFAHMGAAIEGVLRSAADKLQRYEMKHPKVGRAHALALFTQLFPGA